MKFTITCAHFTLMFIYVGPLINFQRCLPYIELVYIYIERDLITVKALLFMGELFLFHTLHTSTNKISKYSETHKNWTALRPDKISHLERPQFRRFYYTLYNSSH